MCYEQVIFYCVMTINCCFYLQLNKRRNVSLPAENDDMTLGDVQEPTVSSTVSFSTLFRSSLISFASAFVSKSLALLVCFFYSSVSQKD